MFHVNFPLIELGYRLIRVLERVVSFFFSSSSSSECNFVILTLHSTSIKSIFPVPYCEDNADELYLAQESIFLIKLKLGID